MCQHCGCADVIKRGDAAVLKQALSIIKELGVTADNVQRFEDGELICGLIASKLAAGEDEEVRLIADWVAQLHSEIYGQRNRSYARAAREVFANFPAGAPPQQVITAWHQLEQLCKQIDGDQLASVNDLAMREAIRAVQTVHDNPQQRRERLLRHYQIKDA